MSRAQFTRWLTSMARTVALLALALVAGTAATGCTSITTDYCDLRCDCEGCSDNQRDECFVEQEARADQADVYDCADLHDDYLQCVVDRPLCEGADFRNPAGCEDAKDRRNSCEGDRGIRIDLRAR